MIILLTCNLFVFQSALNLRQMTAALSGAIFSELSVHNMLRTREIGKRERPKNRHVHSEQNASVSSLNGAFSFGEKASIINK